MKTRAVVIILTILSLMPLLHLLHPGVPRGHDTPDHVARIANFYQSLAEGNIVPRWAGNLNWGYGHPILMFLYPLPSYIASLFHAVGFSFVDSTKLVFALSFAASVLAMYLFARAAWGVLPGLAAAILYGFAPYRFVDLYVRGAIGEHVAFVFPPIILWGLLKIARDRQPDMYAMLGVTLGWAGLILSHNAVALIVWPLVLLYGVYLLVYETKNRVTFLLRSAYSVLLGFLLSAFFWMPAFFEGKYTLRDTVTKGDFTTRFVPWQWFLLSPWNYGGGSEFTKELGLAQWVSIALAFIVFLRTKARKTRWLIGAALLVVIASLWLMTGASSVVWEKVSILQKFQFPWRLLTVPVMISSILGAAAVTHVPKRFQLLTVFCLLSIVFLTTASMWRAKEYIVKPEVYYSGIYDSTTDTGESSPIWSVRFMERRPNAIYEVIEGEGTIVLGSRRTTRHEFMINARTEARIVDNTLYFPGWDVFIDGKMLNKITELIYQDPMYRGLMTFRVPAGEHRVVVSFSDTKLRKVANAISLTGLVLAFLTYETFRRHRRI